jgi:branched-chain amino acid transport system permease protein
MIAICASIMVGLLLYWLAIAPARDASAVSMIIITIGASILLKGLAQVVFDKQFHKLPSFSGDAPIGFLGAAIQPQSLWVVGGTAIAVAVLYAFLEKTLVGKAVLATSASRLAARLVGINTARIMALSFGGSAAIGALAGILVTPITLTSYDVGTMMALKGFAAAMLGGMGNPLGAVVGGLLLGLLETFGAGYVSSTYKDAFAFIMILVVLFFMPQGLLGRRTVNRV